ncbi:MAG: hypothetical protein K2J51_05360 [Alistipes sp.]|nr:hypothetical protein [Alistipes sp.]MDE6778875.1 hypothetical protein [Alistipes sp.]
MYIIASEVYDRLAECLRDAIGGSSYFSGSVAVIDGDTECRLTASLIVYRERIVSPEGTAECISDIVPVWWESRTTCGAEEMLDDCDFAEIRRRLAEC